MSGACKKCGRLQIVSPIYDRRFDLLRYRCTCGYTWAEPALDRSKSASSSVAAGRHGSSDPCAGRGHLDDE